MVSSNKVQPTMEGATCVLVCLLAPFMTAGCLRIQVFSEMWQAARKLPCGTSKWVTQVALTGLAELDLEEELSELLAHLSSRPALVTSEVAAALNRVYVLDSRLRVCSAGGTNGLFAATGVLANDRADKGIFMILLLPLLPQ
jgi:hypothetical protein